jgi:uncharacterized membrane protein
MDATHLHLLLNHFPIVGTIIGIGILAYGLFSKNNSIKKIALSIFIIMAIITIPVFLTGEGAEETVEHLQGVSEELIEEHEELAEKAIWLMMVLGILSLTSLYAMAKNKPFAKMLTIISFMVSLATFGFFAKVGNLGGQIRHTEIRTDAANYQSDDNHKLHDDD